MLKFHLSRWIHSEGVGGGRTAPPAFVQRIGGRRMNGSHNRSGSIACWLPVAFAIRRRSESQPSSGITRVDGKGEVVKGSPDSSAFQLSPYRLATARRVRCGGER